jgi:hypothetical protein
MGFLLFPGWLTLQYRPERSKKLPGNSVLDPNPDWFKQPKTVSEMPANLSTQKYKPSRA